MNRPIQSIASALAITWLAACGPAQAPTTTGHGNGPQACTEEAKQCADGSSVARSGPNCEFAPCPGEAVACTQDAKKCPDGSFVSRTGPNCEFADCPK